MDIICDYCSNKASKKLYCMTGKEQYQDRIRCNEFEFGYSKTNKLVFISEDGNSINSKLIIDGKEVKGIRSLTIEADVDDIVITKIEYVTPAMEG